MSGGDLHHLARELACRPVAIEARSYAAVEAQLAEAIRARVAGGAEARVKAPITAAPDRDDGAPPPPPFRVVGDVAVVEMRGICGRHLSALAMECGGCDVDRVAAALRLADEDPATGAIVLAVDSPGGSVAGVAECAAAVAACRKPIVAAAEDQCCSAAYWIASQADALYCGPTADIGSVGVYCAILDRSAEFEREGRRAVVVRSGALKGAGIDGTSLSEAQLEDLQRAVDAVGAVFRADVRRARDIAEEALDGRVRVGAEAVAEGFADEVGTVADAIRDAGILAARVRGGGTTEGNGGNS